MVLPFDPERAIAELARADRKLGALIKRAGPFAMRPETMTSPFEALLRAIVSQQLSGKAAATILGRVVALYPGKRRLKPETILDTPDEQLRGAGMSRAKVAALKDLASKTLDGTVPSLPKLQKMPDEEIVERLVQVRGIGRWSVEMLLIFRLGRPDVFPHTDLGVRRGFMLTYGGEALPTLDAMTPKSERWRPFRSVASWYLWRAVDLHRKAHNT